MGSRGMARCVKMKHRRLGPTRCLRSFQWRRGWTASYRLIWRSDRRTDLGLPLSFPTLPLLSLSSFSVFFSSYSLPFSNCIPHFPIAVIILLCCNYHLHDVISCDSIQLRTFSMMSQGDSHVMFCRSSICTENHWARISLRWEFISARRWTAVWSGWVAIVS